MKNLNKCRHLWAIIEQQRETEILSNHEYVYITYTLHMLKCVQIFLRKVC